MDHLFVRAALRGLLGSLLIGAHGALAAPSSADRPDRIYHQYCSVCHGERGDGMSMARYALDPPPADFTSAQARKEFSRSHMIETLKKGATTPEGAPTAMVAWTTQLDDAQIEAVVDYIIVSFMDGRPAAEDSIDPLDRSHAGHDHSAARMNAADYPYGLAGDADRGKSLYRANCAGCHGALGDGRGGAQLPPGVQPRNFQAADFKAFATGYSLYSAISRGNPHMPIWEKTMSRQQIADVAEYVLVRFVGKTAEAGPDGHQHDHGDHKH